MFIDCFLKFKFLKIINYEPVVLYINENNEKYWIKENNLNNSIAKGGFGKEKYE